MRSSMSVKDSRGLVLDMVVGRLFAGLLTCGSVC